MAHAVRMSVGMFEGHPDDLWDGHDWDAWWDWLTPDVRERLLELAWGDDPIPATEGALTRLRGATTAVEAQTVTATGRHTVARRRAATDEFLVFLEEKRAAAADRPR